MFAVDYGHHGFASPSPHGEGGLKSGPSLLYHPPQTSLPARGGWIEILMSGTNDQITHGPSPHGEGGLKCPHHGHLLTESASLPARGGWIEILLKPFQLKNPAVPPRTGRVD